MKYIMAFHLWVAVNIASNRILLALIVFCVLGTGTALSAIGFLTAFQRSGAVLVCIAIYGVYLKLFVETEYKTARSDYSRANILRSSGSGRDVTVREALEYQQLNKSKEEMDEIAEKMEKRANSAEKALPVLEQSGNNIVALEVIAGVVGTLIWAFGDLPFSTSC